MTLRSDGELRIPSCLAPHLRMHESTPPRHVPSCSARFQSMHGPMLFRACNKGA